ncbi:amino acid adenylation domain-containing protein [Streptomyces sp. NPDC040724]|uniref:amino acid adenylation domain-containing protein n=1 Tax=Streptomyces sp. NPDC040724 TaxID=3155612 RepID=UPI0033C11678
MTHPSRSGPEAVAIIGVALALPDAYDLDALHENLLGGRVSTGAPSKERVYYGGAPVDVEYPPMAYLNRIDLFDHRFFGISRREAELMDPHQRMTVQLAHQAIENACYAPGDLKGSRTAVVLSTPDTDYKDLYTEPDPQQILGSHPSATAARISYLLDLQGPTAVVDTACSSSLTAIAVAVENLRNGQADLALAGGLSVYPVLVSEQDRVPMPGLESAEVVCRPFDARADGATGGEGGGLVLLKRLSDALADGDHIHGVLRGIAVNHNGFRATGMSAPSARGQAEAIVEAWRQAGPAPVDYIECHGSGTKLGDVIEAEGLRLAFAEAGLSDPCGISGIKGNIGHLNHAAGVAGLFKVLAGLRHGSRYPNPNFETPNPLIDFSGAVHVDAVATPWEHEEGRTRRAGVSSAGLTGTNVHAVVEEPPPAPAGGAPAGETAAELVTLSAKSPRALAAYAERVAEFLDRTGHRLAEVAHALNRGRDDHPFRWAAAARDKDDLAALLRAARTEGREPSPKAPLVLLFSGDADLGDATWAALRAAFPQLADAEAEAESLPESGSESGSKSESGSGDLTASPGSRLLARQQAAYGLVRSLGLTENRLVGNGVGNLVVRSVQDPATAAESRRKAADAPLTGQVDEAGLRRAVRNLADEGAVLVELAADGALAREINRVAPELPVVRLFADPSREGVLSALGTLYSLGVDLDWNRHYQGTGVRRVEVPTYPFDADEVSCWCTPPGAPLTARRAGAPAEGTAPEPFTASGRGDTAARLAGIWARVLKAEKVLPDSNYFGLGGTSIAGITVLRQAQEQFGVRLAFADLHRHPTLRELAARIDELRAAGPERGDWTITPIPRPGRLPLSFNQEQLWYLDRLKPGTPLYNIPAGMRLVGAFDREAFHGALRDVVGRQEVLRTRILDEDGRPYALADLTEPHLTFHDLAALPEAERLAELARVIDGEATEPFDLAHGPLFRTVLIKVGEQDHVVLHTWHHIAFDGWTPAVFFRELTACYTARRTGGAPDLPELPVQYADFAAWQRQWLDTERMERGLEWWRARLRGLDAAELPLDHPRPPVQSFRGDTVRFTLDPEVARRLRDFSVGESTTSFVTMLAVIDAVLHLWAGQRDVVVGAATTGRYNPATHHLVGYFNNLLPFRTEVDPELGFRALVARCATTANGVLDHEEIPFARIVADADHRDASRHPVFTVCYTHQNTARPSEDMDGLTVDAVESLGKGLTGVAGVAPGTSKFDLTIGLYDQDGGPMDGYLEYAVDLFEPETARRLVDLLQELAAAAMAEPDRPLAELLRGDGEPSVLVGDPRDPGDGRLVGEVFEEHAASRPDEVAVVDGAGGHTFREIDERANRLAHRLIEHGVGPDSTVPVIAPRGADLVVGWLGVLKAGAAFASIDPAVPERRIRSILAGLTAPALVVGEGMAAWDGEGIPAVRIADADADADADGVGVGAAGPPQRAGLANLAYVSHTSGSTGHPHGCEVEHRSLLNLLRWYGEEAGLGPADRIAQTASPAFDMAVLEVMSALYYGATLCFVRDLLQTPDKLLAELAEQCVTVACLPTPLAELVLAEPVLAEPSGVPGLALRLLTTGGDLLRVRPRGAPFALLNIYGPTECVVCATAGRVAEHAPHAGTDELPDIGRPLPNVRVYLLDDACRPVPAGRRGEVYLGGAGVGRGYHGRPGLTASRFVADPFADEPGARMYRTGDLASVRSDGTLEFHGRADDQLELRGHRVEPAEIERVLMQHPRVREALVVAGEQPSGAPLLVAHVSGEDLPGEAELTAWVARELPEHMVPGRTVRHDDLPRTSNGKLDRHIMRERHVPNQHSVSELTAVTTTVTRGAGPDAAVLEAERVLGGIWTDLLGIAQVAPGDNFFEVGGDSLLSVGIAARAERAGLTVTPHDVLEHPTLRALAAVAVARGGAPVSRPAAAPAADVSAAVSGAVPAAVSAPVLEPVPPSPLVQAMLATSGTSVRDFIRPLVLETAPGIRTATVRAAFERLVELQEPLRYRFRHNSLGWRIECAERENTPFFDARVLPPLDEEQVQAHVEADVAELFADVDLARGPVFRARFYDRGAGLPGLILFAVHHFVYDALSFVPLIEDLNAALGGNAPAVPRRAAWREWTHQLRAMAASDEVAAELPYWKGILGASGGAHAVPENGTPGGPPSLIRRTVADRVAPQLSDSGPSGQQAAVAAVAVAWSRWRGTPDAFVSTLGMGAAPNALWHGDRSTSFGWFTHLFPAHVPVAPGAGPAEVLPAAGAALSVPNDGIGYGVLRHLSPHSPEVAELRALPEPPVIVEHLANANNGLLKLTGDGVRLRSMPHAALPDSLLAQAPVVVETHVIDGRLELGVVFRGSVAAADMEALADHLVEAFTELAAAGTASAAAVPDGGH